jgi:N-acetylglutamate synthase
MSAGGPEGSAVALAASAVGATRDELARRVEESGLNNMHTRRQLLYDGWLLFLLAGKAKRGRSVNAHFGSTLPLAEKIAHCERLYARHGLPTLFRITPFARPENLETELAARGYVQFDPTLVQVATLESPPVHHGNPQVELGSPLIEAFVEAVGEMRGSPATQRAAHLERLVQSPLDVHTVVARRDGVPVGAGLLCIDGGLAGVFDVVTVTPVHGQGIATAVVSALLTRAWERGVRQAFMQVTADNAPAVALYRKFGFATLYSYHYRARPDECR